MNSKLLSCSVALAALPSIALAQPYYRDSRVPRYEPQYEAQSYAVRRGAAQCYAWCQQDGSPCDPANFKIADARCAPAQGFER